MPKGYSAHNQRAGRTVAERLAFYSRRAANGCLLWIGAKTKGGYGKLSVGGRFVLAHRAAWEQRHGPIPPGMRVLHDCPAGDTPACIEVDHLWLGTAADNTADMIAKDRQGSHMRPAASR